MQDRVVGRDATLVLALAALESTGRVIVEGPAGIGKTALLRALVEAAAASGQLVLRCAPTESEAALPLAAFADLVAPLVDDLAALSEPQQRAVRSALLLGSEDGAVDERTLASATLALLESAADRTPAGVLVVVDDALWLDQPSERALRFALRRTSARVRVVVSSRSDGADTPLGMDDRAEHVRLAPLGVGPLHHLLTERFGISLSRPVVARVAQESGGNPLLAIELTRALLRLPRMPGPGADFPVPASMHDVVAASLAMLPPEGVRAVRLAALLSAPTLADLTAAGVPGDALDAAEEVGLVVVEDVGRVRFTHPVHASAVRAGVPAGVRRRLHEQLAAASTDPDERARHLARCTTEPSSQVATELGLAARRARSRGAPDAAAELYDRAAALCRDDGTAPTYRLRALSCVFDSGSYGAAADRADALVRDLDGDPLAEALLLRAAIAFSVDDLPLAVATGERALAAAQPESRLAGRIHARLASFVDLAGPARDHAREALRLLDAATDETDGALLASVLTLVFLNEVRTGLPPQLDLLDRALALEAGDPSWLAGTVPAIWWKAVDEHGRAVERLESMLGAAVGDEPLQHELMEHLAEAETLAGRYDRASAWVDGAHELAVQLGSGDAAGRWLAGALAALRGDTDAGRAAGEAGLAEAAASADPWLRRLSLQLCAFVALADGRLADAATTYGRLAAAMDATGLAEPLASRFEPDWLEACIGVGDLTGAERALERLAARHARLPRPWTALGLARSRVLLAGAAGLDTAPLVEELLAVREATPPDVLPFDRARCLLVAGLAHRRARRKMAARGALLAAAAEFEALGAVAFAARARADARRTGLRAADPEGLSSSELSVAGLAAGGGDQPGDRRRAVRQPEDGRGEPRAGLPQARDHPSGGAARRPDCAAPPDIGSPLIRRRVPPT